MSWDVALYRFDGDYATLADVPDDGQLLPLGPRPEVEGLIVEVFPGTVFEPPQRWGIWGRWAAPSGSIEFSTGHDPHEVLDVMLHVRAGDEVVPGIVELAERIGCRALDLSAGEFLTNADDGAGLRRWREYRDRVVAAAESEPTRERPSEPGELGQPG